MWMLYTGNNQSLIEEIKSSMKKFVVTNLGKMRHFSARVYMGLANPIDLVKPKKVGWVIG
jgi:archaellum biogenesis protein FlaJ (TadC family)